MTGRTHDLAAFTGLTLFITTQAVPQMTLATAATAIGANLLGGLLPDVDKPTSALWNGVPAGSIAGIILSPLMGTHRLISHSLVGIAAFSWITNQLLRLLGQVLIVDMNIVWWTMMIGYISHLVLDTFTKEGVPWLFPIPVRFGFPPFKALRVTTDGMWEKGIIYPGLMLLNGYLIYSNYQKILDLLTHLLG